MLKRPGGLKIALVFFGFRVFFVPLIKSITGLFSPVAPAKPIGQGHFPSRHRERKNQKKCTATFDGVTALNYLIHPAAKRVGTESL
ncbi:MAG: hypothetical protein ABI036_05160 [Fibrobacteria bacterium]